MQQAAGDWRRARLVFPVASEALKLFGKPTTKEQADALGVWVKAEVDRRLAEIDDKLALENGVGVPQSLPGFGTDEA